MKHLVSCILHRKCKKPAGSDVVHAKYDIPDNKYCSRGLTLLETIIWIGMFTMVMGAVTSSIIYFYRTSSFAMQEATAITAAQHGIDAMMRTIREAAYASNGAYPIVSFGNNDLTFYADVDGDSAIERVHYYAQGTNLYEGIVNPSGTPIAYSGEETVTVLAEDVRNLSQSLNVFTYYDASGLLITNFANISGLRFVTTNVAVDIDTAKPPAPIIIRSSAAMRNLVGR